MKNQFFKQFKTFAIVIFQLFAISSFSQKKALQSITEHELKKHLEFIASDYMQGRDFGTEIPGLEIIAEYLKSECLNMNLKPGAENFKQPVKMISIEPDKRNSFIRLKDSNGLELFKTSDFTVFSESAKNDTIQANIVFAGYGLEGEEYNDFEGQELKDKVVLIMTRNIETAGKLFLNKDLSKDEMTKFGRIFMSGAKAIIYVPDPLTPDTSWFDIIKEYALEGSYKLYGSNSQDFSGIILLANTQIADAILKESGKALKDIQQEINLTANPHSFELKDANIEIQTAKNKKTVTGQNIIGIIEGSDPKLKNECVVLTAHYDHIGITSKGEINNGADDNGSGTVALLEIAEAFSQLKKKPRRSIVFAWVTAEEKGLFGSEYYTLHPVFPLKKTIANINLDMVGRSAEKELEKVDNPDESLAGPNGIYIISDNKSSALTNISNKICADLHLIPSDALTDEFMNSSDHYNFYKKGIPVIAVSTGLHKDYHKPGDDFDKIDYHKMKRICDYTFLVVNEIANRKKRLVLDKDSKEIKLY